MITRTTIMILTVAALTAAAQAQPREPGLVVRLYDIGENLNWLPELAPDQKPNRVLVVPTLDLRTNRDDFAPLKECFISEVTGTLTIKAAGTYTLRLISDDGAKLWLDGRLLIDHDGHHGAVPKEGEIELATGAHDLRISHFNNYGDGALALDWRTPSAAGDVFEPVPAEVLSHAAGVSRETAPGKKRIIPPLRRGLPGDGTPVAGMHPSFKSAAGVSEYHFKEETWHSDGHLRAIGVPQTTERAPVAAWLPPTADLRPYQLTGAFNEEPYSQQLWVFAFEGESKRVFLDRIGEARQGCAFRFAEMDPVLQPTGVRTFEMLAVRAMTNGFEIEFTKALDPRCGWEADSYYVEQWPFDLRSEISDSRPPRRDGIRYPVKSASVSADRKKVFLEIPDLKESHVVYIRLLPPCVSEDGQRPWSTEAWYTLNEIPKDRIGNVLTPPKPEPQDFLTAEEKAAGWELLFDGETTAGWRGYRKDHMPDGWQVVDGSLVRVGSAGDIICERELDNFELTLEWRICAAGNSGIFYRVNEEFDWPFFTGPEMQVLDNAEHADGRNAKTSAGSNYALHAPVRDVTEPIGFFNQVRIVANGPHVEHWLNGEKIVEYELWSDEWKQLVADSKFNAWPNYGLMKKGHIVLQDHGDQVWYRNIKVRPLRGE